MHLLRGTGKTTSPYFDKLRSGPLGNVFSLGDEVEVNAASASAEDLAKFDTLTQLWGAQDLSISEPEVVALQETLDLLKETYGIMSSGNERIDRASAALSWPIRVPDLYIEMVGRKQPEALILLAHYSLLLNLAKDFWWLQGMSRQLLQTTYKSLPEYLRDSISWPLQDLIMSEFRN